MSGIVTDRAINEQAKWDARQGDSQPITINFSLTQAGKEFEATIYRPGGATLATLNEDNGKIVNNGTNIVITLSGDDAAIMADTYEWKLRSDNDFTWFCAPFVLHNGAWGGSTTSSVDLTIDVGGTSVDIEITIAGNETSFLSFRSTTFDASSGNFPSTGGRHTDGAPAKFDAWIIGTAGTLAGQDVSIGTIIMANVNGPGSAWGSSTGWSILRF